MEKETKEKPLSEKIMHHRLWAKDVAEAVKKLKENYKEKLRSIKEWMELDNAIYSQDYDKMKANRELLRTLKKEIDKIFGEFHSPQENYSEKSRFVSPEDNNSPHTKTRLVGGKSLSENKTEGTHARQVGLKEGCGEVFSTACDNYLYKCGKEQLCPKCEDVEKALDGAFNQLKAEEKEDE